jgi:hypothetical protein
MAAAQGAVSGPALNDLAIGFRNLIGRDGSGRDRAYSRAGEDSAKDGAAVGCGGHRGCLLGALSGREIYAEVAQ